MGLEPRRSVKKLSERNVVAQVANYSKAIARYRGGGTLEEVDP